MTMPIMKVAPVRKSIRVNASPEHAFDVFTRSMARWWPAPHTILKSPLKHMVLEPHLDGRWYQVGEDGSQCELGRVLAWEPPGRVLLSWQINSDWQYDPGLVTEVEFKFVAEGDRATRVELEHRLLERMGAKAESTRAQIDAPGGWSAILESFRQNAEA